MRVALIDGTGLRANNEELRPYLNRIAAPLPSESRDAYAARTRAYRNAINAAVQATMRIRVIPALADQSLANATLWKRATRDAEYLAIHGKRSDTAVEHALAASGDAGKSLASELNETIAVVLSLLDTLRDARP